MDIQLPTYTYKTYRLDPHSPNINFLAGKYASLSQRALTVDPGSFGVAYSTESAFSPSDYLARVSRPNVHLFVCVAHSSTLPEDQHTIEYGHWVGMITQIGPTPKEAFWMKLYGGAEPLDDALETKWHQTSTWIDPAHRGRGVAKQTIEAAVAYAAESMTGTVTQARIRAITGPDNMLSKALYGGRGFPVAGKCTILEAMVANGNSQYPFHGRTDWPEEIMKARIGVVMERIVKRSD